MPVRIQLVSGLREPPESAYGTCSKGKKNFIIRMDRGFALMAPELMVKVLLHEWSHAIIWDIPDEPEHGDLFWITYGRLWRIWKLDFE